MSQTTLHVRENDKPLSYTFEDLMLYHGPGFPGGVAHALKVMERALPALADGAAPERREIVIRTAFKGPGGRDAFEMVTRANSEGRYTVDPDLARPERGPTLANYVFELTYRGKTVTATIRDGHVRDEFIALGKKTDRTPEETARHTYLKQEMADRLLKAKAEDVYDLA